MLPVEEPQGDLLNVPGEGEQSLLQPNQVELTTPHNEEQTTNHSINKEDKPTFGKEEGETSLKTPPPDKGGTKPATRKRGRKQPSSKWTTTDYEHAKDEKHRLRAVELEAKGEKYTPRPSATKYRGDATHIYSFVYTDNVNLFTYTIEGGSEPESGYESNEDIGPTFEEQQQQSWQSLHKGRLAVRIHTSDSTHRRERTANPGQSRWGLPGNNKRFTWPLAENL